MALAAWEMKYNRADPQGDTNDSDWTAPNIDTSDWTKVTLLPRLPSSAIPKGRCYGCVAKSKCPMNSAARGGSISRRAARSTRCI